MIVERLSKKAVTAVRLNPVARAIEVASGDRRAKLLRSLNPANHALPKIFACLVMKIKLIIDILFRSDDSLLLI